MAPNQLTWTVPSLHRYRPAILILTALAAGCTIYYIHESFWSTTPAAKQAPALHRSNARRRRRRSQTRQHANTPSEEVPSSLDFLSSEEDARRIYGWYAFRNSNGDYTRVSLTRNILNHDSEPSSDYDLRDEDIARFREEVQPVFLNLYLYHHLRAQALSEPLRQRIISTLEQDGFSQSHISSSLDRQQSSRHREIILLWMQTQAHQLRQIREDSANHTQVVADFHRIHQEVNEPATVENSDSEASWQGENDQEDGPKEGQNLLNMLFRIAEEQARREGYIHRGISCNGCNANPIKGVRYRCVNCMDYDLCEACEALQIHPKTHLFYKVRIPRSHLGQQPQPLKYPGKYTRCPRNLPRNTLKVFCEQTDYKQSEIEGFWDQFKCLAAADWPTDPHHFHLAIDHRAFEQLFMPSNSTRPPPPNLIYDRVFSFYDTDNNDLIGFEEFVVGLSNLHKKGPKEKWKRIFKGFDIDGDGFVDRKDFLRMFKAHYSLTKVMTAEIIAGVEDENDEEYTRELITSGRPLSSAFTHSIPAGQTVRTNEGKTTDAFGDNTIFDHRGVLNEEYDEDGASEDVIAQRADEKVFGKDPMMHYRRNDVQTRIRSLYEDPWPPAAVQIQDIIDVVHKEQSPGQIEDSQVQKDIRRACHKRLAQVWQKRHYVGWQAVRDRSNSSAFFLNHQWSSTLSKQPRCEDSERSATLVRPTHPEPSFDKLIKSKEDDENFNSAFTELISNLKWPLSEPKEFRRSLLEMICKGWSGAEIVENFKCYSIDTIEIEDFIQKFLGLFEVCTPPLENKVLHPAPLRRSRSSSKVRFEDGLTTDNDDEQDVRSVTSVSSRSIPINERWGGYEIPEPEEDVGREVLYQVTQEALNEVIDPIFKMREDLWLEGQATKEKRQRYRATMCATIVEPQSVVDVLHSFLKHCRIKQNYPPKGECSSTRLERSEAQIFHDFMKYLDKGVLNQLTSEKCTKCRDSRIAIPQKACAKCGVASIQWKQVCEESKNLRTEKCDICMQQNKSSRIRDGDFCGRCRNPSTTRRREDERLWSILAGSTTPPKPIRSSPTNNFVEFLDDLSKTEGDQAEKIEASGDPNISGKESPSLSLSSGLPGGMIPQTAIATNPAPNTIGEEEDTVPNQKFDIELGDISESASSPAYPEAAMELHDSVQGFIEGDRLIEQKIAQKRLDELLEESGYEIVDEAPLFDPCSQPTSSNHPSPPTSPPQNIPEPVHNTPRPDPTLPQNRPNSAEETAIPTQSARSKGKASSRKSSKKTKHAVPDKTTLKFWAALYILEAEDRERGGPGKLSEKEFLEIMLGERGKSLEFIGEWMNLTAF